MQRPRMTTRHFTRDLVLAFLLLAAMVMGAVFFFAAKAREDIAQKYIDNAALGAGRQFEALAAAVDRSLQMVADWVAAVEAPLTEAGDLDRFLLPLMQGNPLVFGISVADTDGNSYYLNVHGDGWRTSRTRAVDNGRQSVVHVWNADKQPISEAIEPSAYDPRRRPWFSPALATDAVFWTPPYRFFTAEKVGVTGALARPAASGGGGQIVVAFDILLDDLFRDIQRMAPSANSRVVVIRNDARLYEPASGDGHPAFRAISENDDPLVREMVAVWERGRSPSGAAFSIRHDQETWWCGFRPLARDNRNVWIGVMVPESDIIGGVGRRQIGLWSVGGLAVLLAGGLAFLIMRRYGPASNAPEEGFDAGTPEKSLRDLIAKGEGRTVEFKSSMRLNLHTQKPGKEIELAWLKAVVAFMNTDGGTLLLGVADDGRITGLAQDGFANDDKCRLHFKNLIGQHIGAELSRNLQFHLVQMDGQQVGVVSCRRSAEPVFLKSGKEETFYIRSGPSSDALPVSKVVSYLQKKR